MGPPAGAIRIAARQRFEAAIFDMDGVLTRTAHVHAAAWKDLFDEYLARLSGGGAFEPFDPESDYRRYVDGKPRYEGVRSFLAARDIELPYGDPSDSPEQETVCGLGNRKNELLHRRLRRDGVEVFASSVRLIERFRRRGLATAVVSSSKNCSLILDLAGLARLFDTRVDGIDAEALDLRGKPEPDLFLEAVHRLGARPGRCIVFEDAIAGVEAAKRGGFGVVVGVDRYDGAEMLRQAGADVVVKDLAEIEVEVRIDDLPAGCEAIDVEEQVRDKEVIVFLDYDGTLTPIVSRPEDAILSDEMRAAVRELARQCKVAVVSGRGLEDVRKRIGIEDVYYAGSHGFEIVGPGGLAEDYGPASRHLPILDEAQAALEERLKGTPGAQVERKKYSIAVHYRNVRDEDVATVEEAVDGVRERHRDLRKGHGKKVFELQPNVEWHKGRALLWLLERLHLNRPDVLPVYVGDDITDEDAFRALEWRGVAIVVGEGERETAAQYRLRDPDEVRIFLRRLGDTLEQRGAWRWSYEGFDPGQEGLREALCTLGNGYFATRGAASESRADGVHYPGTYLAGGYNRLETAIAGRRVVNEDLVNLPNWLCLEFRIAGQKWFALSNVEILSYHQELDIEQGVLRRTVHFRDAHRRETRLLQRRLVSMSRMHLAAQQTVITPLNWSGEFEIRSALDGRVRNAGVARYRDLNNQHLEPVDESESDLCVVLRVRTSQSGLTVAQAARTEILVAGKPAVARRASEKEPGYVGENFVLEVEPGIDVTVEKVVALHTSRDAAVSECGLAAREAATQAGRFASLSSAHSLAWKHLWERFDLRLRLGEEADHQIQRIVRLYSFHLLQTACMHSLDVDVGMPSRGWHGEAYRGHIFWDELIIFPFLNYRVPQITRALLMYRYRRLGEARKAARELGYHGAMFPWQSGSDGREETQKLHLNPRSGRWISDNTHLQRHINAAIVYNVWQYFQVTADLEFLSFYGAEMIFEIARFWASIATYNRKLDRYEIAGVVGPDEFHDAHPGAERPGLKNNAYTNVMAVFVLNRALQLFDRLPGPECRQLCETLEIEESEKHRWEEITRKMRVPFHDGDIISQFEGYEQLEELDWAAYRERYGNIQRLDRILEAEGDTTNRYKVSKQADVLMLFYLFSAEELAELFGQLGYDFHPDMIPKNIDYYLRRTSNGSSLSWVIHAWVAARRDRVHSWRLFQEALRLDVADVQGGTTAEGIHLGAMAGCVDLIQRCYTGLEVHAEVLHLNPQLPEGLDGIHTHLRYRGHWLEVEISTDRIVMESMVCRAEPIDIDVRGRRFRLEPGKALTIEIAD